MQKVHVRSFGTSLDGYGAGPNQRLEHPLGVRGHEMMAWFFPTDVWKSSHMGGGTAGEQGTDNAMAAHSFENVGAWIMGRNMFGPIRGPWLDDAWKGWWGDDPPYHVPVFVLTHHAREPIVMAGGTTFHFVTAGIHAALEQARDAAGDADIRIGGGVATVRQYLQARLLDEMHITVSPVLLGSGEHLTHGLDLDALGYRCDEMVAGERTTHFVIRRKTAETAA